jgi:hypothetical protein
MLKIEITEQEQKLLIESLDLAVRHSQSTLVAASQLLPLAAKIQAATTVEPVEPKA